MSLSSRVYSHSNIQSLSPGTGIYSIYYVGAIQKTISKLISFLCVQIFFDAVKTAVRVLSMSYVVDRKEAHTRGLKTKCLIFVNKTLVLKANSFLLGK